MSEKNGLDLTECIIDLVIWSLKLVVGLSTSTLDLDILTAFKEN